MSIPFEKSFASNDKSKYWSEKNELKPDQVYKVSAKKYLFNCPNCKHEFLQNPSHIKSGRWCPYCCIPQKKLCCKKDCKFCFDKSFASHEKSKYWSVKNELKPEFVLKNGDKRIWFKCNICNHDFETQIKNITKGQWCPYCKSNTLCDENDCIFCFEKSFASHEKSKYWSLKNKITPRNIVKGTSVKYWFNCDKCSHDFIKDIHKITGSSNGWCPYCANKKMCDNDECKECHEKSFASHEKIKYWSVKNIENPRYLFQGDSGRYLFNCDKCDLEFESVLYNVKSGYWCPFCINKTETKFYKIIKKLFPSIIYQFKAEWCKNKTFLPFDFCIPEHKIIIEIDGPQHFTQIMQWKPPEEQFKIDKYKENCANINNYSVIRIIQNDVLLEKYNWLKDLYETIEELKNGDEIANVYLCKNGEYDLY